MKTKNTGLICALFATFTMMVVSYQNCGGGSSETQGLTAPANSTVSLTGKWPAAPVIGTQLNRYGRPETNFLFNHTFDSGAGWLAAQTQWNSDSDQANWNSYASDIAANIGILDAFDGAGNCGNQILAGPTPSLGRYDTLAGILADDRLWVKLNASQCTQYFAVELNATNALANQDCGGRKLDYDVVDAIYSMIISGDLAANTGDGIPADADTKGTGFPYLAPPHP